MSLRMLDLAAICAALWSSLALTGQVVTGDAVNKVAIFGLGLSGNLHDNPAYCLSCAWSQRSLLRAVHREHRNSTLGGEGPHFPF
jgi:hypothetical protein